MFLWPEINSGVIKDAGTVLDCDIKCSLPPAIENGQYLVVSSGNFIQLTSGDFVDNGTVLLYECDHGYYPEFTSPINTCHNGEWKTRFSGCIKSNKCILPEFPENGNYKITGPLTAAAIPGEEVLEYTILEFSCAPLYDLINARKAVCTGATWSKNPPSCKRNNRCVIPSPPRNGQYSIIGSNDVAVAGEVAEERAALTYGCDPGYILNDRDMIYCLNGTWIGEPIQCEELRSCELPLDGDYVVIGSSARHVAGDRVEERTTIRFSCRDPFQLSGPEFAVCSNGKWSSGVPRCLVNDECSSIYSKMSGVYTIQPISLFSLFPDQFRVYCEMNVTDEKWTVIQQRIDDSIDFYRDYEAYKRGFGCLTGSHWLGLEKIHFLTKDGDHELYVEMESFDGIKKFARYSTFIIGDSDSGYKLTVGGHSGTAGDSMGYNSGMKFSTFDHDEDFGSESCAEHHHGAWWYFKCTHINLNGKYYTHAEEGSTPMYWYGVLGNYASLKKTRMMIRRK